MGSKFANLQIRYADPLIVKKRMPDCTVKEFSEGWVTVLHEDFQIGTIEREARKLSKNLDRPVLSVGYYDDDILVLQVYKQGKSVALHVSNGGYGYESRIGNPTHFQQSLDLEETDTSVIKEILKCENLEKKVVLLENLLGVTLWINFRNFEEDEKELNARGFDKSIIYEYIDELKANGKMKNQTKLKLRAELEAMPETCNKFFQLPNANGSFTLNNSEVYEFRLDGKYEPIRVNSEGKNSKGESFLLLLPDGSTIHTSRKPHQAAIFECDSNGHLKWKLEVDFIKVAPVLHIDNLYMHVEMNAGSYILKVNRYGEIVHKHIFEVPTWGGCHWETFINHQNRVFYSCTLNQEERRKTYLYCFDENLAVLVQMELDGTSFDSVLDQELGVLYIYIHLKEIIRVDVISMQITARFGCTDYVELVFVDRNNRLYIKKGESTLELMSPELQIVSRHRLKGQIQWHDINFEGNPCFITWNGNNWDTGKERSLLRVFEITE